MSSTIFGKNRINSRRKLRRAVGAGSCFEQLESRRLMSSYTLSDVGSLGTDHVLVQYLTNSGNVAGQGFSDDGTGVGFVYAGASGEKTLSSISLGGVSASVAGVNDAGQAAGSGFTADGTPNAYFFENGAITPLFFESGAGGGSYGTAVGISSSGDVAGTSILDGVSRAFLYYDGTMHAIGTDILGSQASAISPSGKVAGIAVKTDGTGGAFIYDKATDQMTFLGTFGPNQAPLEAFAVSDSGFVTGRASDVDGDHAFLWNPATGQAIDLNPASGFVSGEGEKLNNAGQVVGTLVGEDGNFYGFIYDGTQTVQLSLGGTLGSMVHDLNQSGVAVGNAYTTDDAADLGFVYDSATQSYVQLTLGGSSSDALDVNDQGTAVGTAFTTNGQQHAFVYQNGAITDLNDLIPADSGWTLTEADLVNENGQIAGVGIYNGEQRVFVLTPEATGPVNTAPIAHDDAAQTVEDNPVTFNVLGNDTEADDGQTLTVTGTSAPSHGTVVVNEDGTLTYSPAHNYFGTDAFTYDVSDGHGGTSSASVAVTILSPAQAVNGAVGTIGSDLVSRGILSQRQANLLVPVISTITNLAIASAVRFHIPTDAVISSLTRSLNSVRVLSQQDKDLLISSVEESIIAQTT